MEKLFKYINLLNFICRIAVYDQHPDTIKTDFMSNDINAKVVIVPLDPILVLNPEDHPAYYVTSIQLPYLTSQELGWGKYSYFHTHNPLLFGSISR